MSGNTRLLLADYDYLNKRIASKPNYAFYNQPPKRLVRNHLE